MSQPPANAGPPAGRKRAVPLKVWALLALLFGGVVGLGMFHLCLRRRNVVSVGRSATPAATATS